VPLARDNRIVLDSAWPHPRFGGSFLPRAPRIDARGFYAEWEVSSLATGAQAQFLAGQALPMVDAGGNTLDARRAAAGMSVDGMDAVAVSLVDPVNVYSQADRATKYGLLFVVLTFGGFFLLEMLKRLPIHPIQYLLVGLALAIFFLLLVGLSEHVAFGRAYVAASVACLGLVGIYLGAVLRSRARGFAFAAALALLYAALYGLLVSEDNALVLGAGLLFAILAAVMVATRKVDGYALTAK
jgi:inner membrane protein